MDAPVPALLPRTRRFGDRIGDGLLHALTAAAAALAVLIVVSIAWKVFEGARPALEKFGLGFLVHQGWNPVTNDYAALDFIFGTALTSFGAVLLAAPISIGIGLYLSELAPRGIRGVIGSLVEMLAAIPSVVLGLWGILVLGPFVAQHLGPFLADHFGWIPIFAGDPTQNGSGQLTAILVLTIMIVPITSSICRELFLSVPDDLEEGAIALGATRWEMVRDVVLQYTKGGVVAAIVLGLGRAIGEAIAVTQVIGGQTGIHTSVFATGDTLASRIAAQYQGAASDLQVAAIVYLAAILLVISLVTNFGAQLVVKRFEFQRVGGD
ncbi:MAG TPA: phosphate ABC transporter permease subunit PstC [Gaiellaceae bacterium]|nr:phosphate ABC transporter permease subunit PstC [Gaiellaceae bacterium]